VIANPANPVSVLTWSNPDGGPQAGSISTGTIHGKEKVYGSIP
jgi:hypothetical protein